MVVEKQTIPEVSKIFTLLGGMLIFRASKFDELTIWGITLYNEQNPSFSKREKEWFIDYSISLATEEEKTWFEYCEQHNEFRSKEEALDNMYTKQFVEQYLMEEQI